MKHQSHISIAILLISILFYSTITTRALDEPEYSYNEKSAKGPQHWGDLKEEWEECKKGEMQSPIDLSNYRVKLTPKLGELKRNYKPQYASVSNRGHDIEVKWEGDAGSIEINGTQFFLQSSHWHWPSEHTINGRRYDLELQMVHVSPQADGKNKTALVGFLYKYGSPDSFLTKLGKYIKEIPDEEEEKSVGIINPSDIIMKMSGTGKKMYYYYRYLGSLTIPPCTQGVIWTIHTKIRTVSRGQVKLLKKSVLKHYAKRNARPLQHLNQREIQLYNPKTKIQPHN